MCLFCPECVLNEGDAAEPGPRRGREQRFVTSACNRFRAVSRAVARARVTQTRKENVGVSPALALKKPAGCAAGAVTCVLVLCGA